MSRKTALQIKNFYEAVDTQDDAVTKFCNKYTGFYKKYFFTMIALLRYYDEKIANRLYISIIVDSSPMKSTLTSGIDTNPVYFSDDASPDPMDFCLAECLISYNKLESVMERNVLALCFKLLNIYNAKMYYDYIGMLDVNKSDDDEEKTVARPQKSNTDVDEQISVLEDWISGLSGLRTYILKNDARDVYVGGRHPALLGFEKQWLLSDDTKTMLRASPFQFRWDGKLLTYIRVGHNVIYTRFCKTTDPVYDLGDYLDQVRDLYGDNCEAFDSADVTSNVDYILIIGNSNRTWFVNRINELMALLEHVYGA